MAKPAFDPSQPFETPQGASGSKPKFDPSKPFEAAQAPQEQDTGGLLGAVGRVRDSVAAAGAKSKNPFLIAENMLLNTEPGKRAQGYVGGIARTGIATITGQAGKEDWKKALVGEAPPSEEYYARAGVPEGNIGHIPFSKELIGHDANLTGRGILGALTDVATDPVTYGALKLGKGKVVTEGGVQTTGKGLTKVASTFSGVPEKEIETYAKHAKQINVMTSAADNDVQEMADQLRRKMSGDISATKTKLNSKISTALEGKSTQTVAAQPIIDELQSAKSKINAKLRPEEVAHVDDLIAKVDAVTADGKISLPDAHDLKEIFQETAKGAYSKGGQIFQVGTKVARAAKSGAAAARSLVNEAAPEIADANNQLSQLHSIEKVMNKSMLAEGKSASPLMAAGTGGNPANASALKRLGAITGTDMQSEAEKLAAARTFGKPSLLPVDATGKSLTRMGAAGAAGFVLGGVPGAVASQGLTSPAAIKAAINTGKALAPAAKAVLESPANSQGVAMVAARAAAQGAKGKVAASTPTDRPIDLQPADKPKKGPAKWANDGADKLLEHAPEDKATIEKAKGAAADDPKVKKLLIAASDLKPNTKAMDALLAKLKAKDGR